MNRDEIANAVRAQLPDNLVADGVLDAIMAAVDRMLEIIKQRTGEDFVAAFEAQTAVRRLEHRVKALERASGETKTFMGVDYASVVYKSPEPVRYPEAEREAAAIAELESHVADLRTANRVLVKLGHESEEQIKRMRAAIAELPTMYPPIGPVVVGAAALAACHEAAKEDGP
jgi:hypothetical protein